MPGKVAIIDCGTNTFHLLIVNLKADHDYDPIYKNKALVNIGRGGISKNIITIEAGQRALSAIEGFASIIKAEEVTEIHAYATSAFRNATNGITLGDKIEELTGIHIEIIDGLQEAELIFKGVKMAMSIGQENCLIMDIGGGSIEFVIGHEEGILWSRSFEIGAQRLLDQFHKSDPISTGEIKTLNAYFKEQLNELLLAIDQFQPYTMIGSSGTFDTLSHIYSYKVGKQPEDTRELPLSLEGYHHIHTDLLAKNRADRLAIPGMIEMRVDMIVVASCVIDYILAHGNIQNLRVSTFALKEGVLSTILNQ